MVYFPNFSVDKKWFLKVKREKSNVFFVFLCFLKKLFDVDNYTPYVKDAFHRYVIDGEKDAINPDERGTKVSAHYVLNLKAGESFQIKIKLDNRTVCDTIDEDHFSKENFDGIVAKRLHEADEFYEKVHSGIIIL